MILPCVADGSSRLQAAVLRLLDMIAEGNEQLLEAQRVQQELLEGLSAKTEEAGQLSERCSELDERLREEVEAKAYLASELNKAEGRHPRFVQYHGNMQNVEGIGKNGPQFTY